jgi:hypothetical protein
MKNTSRIRLPNWKKLQFAPKKTTLYCARDGFDTILPVRKLKHTVNKVSPVPGFTCKSRRDGTLLTVGEA